MHAIAICRLRSEMGNEKRGRGRDDGAAVRPPGSSIGRRRMFADTIPSPGLVGVGLTQPRPVRLLSQRKSGHYECVAAAAARMINGHYR